MLAFDFFFLVTVNIVSFIINSFIGVPLDILVSFVTGLLPTPA